MRIVDTFPRAVREIENLWIPLGDGTRLAARVWLPEDAEQSPVPAILEYIPYRKRDLTRRRDEPMHHYFAGHGYAAVRVDLRGSGDSDGFLTDEYSEQEHDDAIAVINWLTAQSWCSGSVGLMGISWGGFNALQIAARCPPQLKAIITLCASDDRYADDAHYMGGCLLNENLQWGSVLMNFCVYPPDPAIAGAQGRAVWRERLDSVPFFAALWLRHQRRDNYWRHGSVCEDYAAITCPVYVIGGWADGYTNAVPRLLAGLRSPCKGLVGPWAHVFPHDATPGPSIGFLQEARRWWDQWLNGIDTGIMREPAYRVWMQSSVPPQPHYDERPGRWVAEESWPSPRISPRRYWVNAAALQDQPADGEAIVWSSPQSVGLAGGDWCAFGAEGEMPVDQRRDDGASLTFDSQPLAQPVEILGAPVVELDIAVDQPVAFLAVRLNDVAPNGASLRVSYGLLNLTHRQSHEVPKRLEPGRRYRVRLQLNDTAHAFSAGHSLRLAISTSYWPIAWPSPAAVTLTVFPGSGWLEIPVRPPHPADALLCPFGPPEQAPQMEQLTLRPGRFQRTYQRDLATGETVYTVFSDEAEFDGAAIARIKAIDLDVGASILRRYRIGERDPLSASAEIEQKTLFRRRRWSVRIETRTTLCATKEEFVLESTLRAYEGDECIFERQLTESIPRDHL